MLNHPGRYLPFTRPFTRAVMASLLPLAAGLGIMGGIPTAQAGTVTIYNGTIPTPRAIDSRPTGDRSHSDHYEDEREYQREYEDNFYRDFYRDRYRNRRIEDTILVNPIIIDSRIDDSTLVNPIILDNTSPWRGRFNSTGGHYRPSCTVLAHLRAACQ